MTRSELILLPKPKEGRQKPSQATLGEVVGLRKAAEGALFKASYILGDYNKTQAASFKLHSLAVEIGALFDDLV